MNITINTDDATELATDLGMFENNMGDQFDIATRKGLSIYETAVVGHTPVNTGALRGSVKQNINGSGVNIAGEVVTDIIYGWPVEEGRKAGKMPPIGAIEIWVNRKLGIRGLEARRVAYVIARKIGKRGTKGAFMFKQAFEQMTPTVVKLFENAVDVAVRMFGK